MKVRNNAIFEDPDSLNLRGEIVCGGILRKAEEKRLKAASAISKSRRVVQRLGGEREGVRAVDNQTVVFIGTLYQMKREYEREYAKDIRGGERS